MWGLLLLFHAVKLAHVIRWSMPVYCGHLGIMTVFVQPVIECRLYFIMPPSHPQDNKTCLQKKTHFLTLSIFFTSPFPPCFPALALFHSVSLLRLPALIRHCSQSLSVYLMEAKGSKMMLSSNMLYVTVVVPWAVCSAVASLWPYISLSLCVSWLPTPETRKQTHNCAGPQRSDNPNNTHSPFSPFVIH